MRISLKIEHFLKTYFWPLNGNIDQTRGLNIQVHHSRFPKSNFIFMNHHYDVINIPIYEGMSKMNLVWSSDDKPHEKLMFWKIFNQNSLVWRNALTCISGRSMRCCDRFGPFVANILHQHSKNVTNSVFYSCIPWFVLFHFEFHNDHPENGNMVLCCSLLLNKVHSYHSLLLLNRINFKCPRIFTTLVITWSSRFTTRLIYTFLVQNLN